MPDEKICGRTTLLKLFEIGRASSLCPSMPVGIIWGRTALVKLLDTGLIASGISRLSLIEGASGHGLIPDSLP